jgi:predicted acetyltransferase
VNDVVALTEAAARRILHFFSMHASVFDAVVVSLGSPDPLLMLPREEPWEIEKLQRWMLRVVDVPAALAARGYRAGVEGQVHLDVRDEALPSNAGRYVLEVEKGRGSVRKGGKGSLRLDVATLAPLFTGYLTAEDLASYGRIEGAAKDLALASLVFSGPVPWMSDGF